MNPNENCRRGFWIPRKANDLLGLNTNLELGIFIGRMLLGSFPETFIGWPPEAERMGLPNHYAVELAGCKRFTTLKDLCSAVARNSNFYSCNIA